MLVEQGAYQNMLNETQQFFEIVNRSNRILIALKKNPDNDAAVTALALSRILNTEFHKTVEIVSDGFVAPETLSFLSDVASITPSLKTPPGLTITIPTSHTGEISVNHESQNGSLKIHLSPKISISSDSLHIEKDVYPFDLIIAIGVPDLESLGALYQNHAPLFYAVPLINIDNHLGNEYFGQLSYVDVTSSSCAEMIMKRFDELGISSFSKDIATLLLTGIISATNNFKSPRVSPATLQNASRLMIMNADRELIVTNISRIHTLQTLKLWGAVLGDLHEERSLHFVWAVIPREAFIRSQTDDSLLPSIITEIIDTSPTAGVVAIIYEDPNGSGMVNAQIQATSRFDLRVLLTQLQGDKKSQRAHLTFPARTLIEATTSLTNIIRTALEAIR